MIAYIVIGGVGFLFIVLSFIFGELADSIAGLFEHDVHVEVGGHDVIDTHNADVHVGPALFSVRAIAAFATGFGVAGYLAMKAGWNPWMAVLPGLGTGVVMFLAMYGISVLLYRQQATSGYNPQQLVGQTAQITTPIPESGLGEISLIVKGGHEHFAARSSDNQPLAAGTTVKIVSISGNTATVVKS